MDARLDTLSIELYQVNVRVGHIARQQAVMGGFVDSPPRTLEASDAKDDDDDATALEDDSDGDTSFTDEMSTLLRMMVMETLLPFVTRDKKGK